MIRLPMLTTDKLEKKIYINKFQYKIYGCSNFSFGEDEFNRIIYTVELIEVQSIMICTTTKIRRSSSIEQFEYSNNVETICSRNLMIQSYQLDECQFDII